MMKINNRKGAALMQVLLITIILAGIATMLLRASLSRTSSARKTRRSSSANVLIQACMAEVNTFFSSMTEEAFTKHMEGRPYFSCNADEQDGICPEEYKQRDYSCRSTVPYVDSYLAYQVRASFDDNSQLVYEVIDGANTL